MFEFTKEEKRRRKNRKINYHLSRKDIMKRTEVSYQKTISDILGKDGVSTEIITKLNDFSAEMM